MKAPTSVDAASRVTHRLKKSNVKVHESRNWDQLLHGEDTSVWADKGYVSAEFEVALTAQVNIWNVMRKAQRVANSPLDRKANRIIASVRACVEHPFRVTERQFGQVGTRYRGLPKTAPTTSSCSPMEICT